MKPLIVHGLTEDEKKALALCLKRMGFTDYQDHLESKHEARAACDGGEKVLAALADAGFVR